MLGLTSARSRLVFAQPSPTCMTQNITDVPSLSVRMIHKEEEYKEGTSWKAQAEDTIEQVTSDSHVVHKTNVR